MIMRQKYNKMLKPPNVWRIFSSFSVYNQVKERFSKHLILYSCRFLSAVADALVSLCAADSCRVIVRQSLQSLGFNGSQLADNVITVRQINLVKTCFCTSAGLRLHPVCNHAGAKIQKEPHAASANVDINPCDSCSVGRCALSMSSKQHQSQFRTRPAICHDDPHYSFFGLRAPTYDHRRQSANSTECFRNHRHVDLFINVIDVHRTCRSE